MNETTGEQNYLEYRFCGKNATAKLPTSVTISGTAIQGQIKNDGTVIYEDNFNFGLFSKVTVAVIDNEIIGFVNNCCVHRHVLSEDYHKNSYAIYHIIGVTENFMEVLYETINTDEFHEEVMKRVDMQQKSE